MQISGRPKSQREEESGMRFNSVEISNTVSLRAQAAGVVGNKQVSKCRASCMLGNGAVKVHVKLAWARISHLEQLLYSRMARI